MSAIYYVDSHGGWFCIQARTKRKARSAGVEEFGRGGVNECRRATPEEKKDYIRQKGHIDDYE